MIGSGRSEKQERGCEPKCEFGFGCQIHVLTWPGHGGGGASNRAGTSSDGCASSSTGYSSQNGTGCGCPARELG
jgi:hypothetical protein